MQYVGFPAYCFLLYDIPDQVGDEIAGQAGNDVKEIPGRAVDDGSIAKYS